MGYPKLSREAQQYCSFNKHDSTCYLQGVHSFDTSLHLPSFDDVISFLSRVFGSCFAKSRYSSKFNLKQEVKVTVSDSKVGKVCSARQALTSG